MRCVECRHFRCALRMPPNSLPTALGRGSQFHPSNPKLDLAPGADSTAQPCQQEIQVHMPRIGATDINGKSVKKTRVPTEFKQIHGLLAAAQRFTGLYFCTLALTCDLNFTCNGVLFWCLQCHIVTDRKGTALCLCRFVSPGH